MDSVKVMCFAISENLYNKISKQVADKNISVKDYFISLLEKDNLDQENVSK